MNCISDNKNGIFINHNSDWSGEARIAWMISREAYDIMDAKPPPAHAECWVDSRDLLTGLFTPTRTGDPEPPVNVITRAVALAVYNHVTATMVRAAEQVDGVWRRK